MRALLLLLLVLVAGGGGALVAYSALQEEDPAGAKPAAAVSPQKADRAAVRALLLTADDFPRGWTTQRAKGRAATASIATPCPGGSARVADPRSEGASSRFAAPSGGSSAQVTVATFAVVRDAAAALGAFMSPRDLACIAGRLLDVPVSGVRATSVDAPLVGDEAVGARVRAAAPRRATADVVAVRQGRLVLVFTFGAGAEPWTLAERQALIDRVLARAPATPSAS